MTTHTVKSWGHLFDPIEAGFKTHDLRLNDRDYKVGDHLLLKRYDFISGRYTGQELLVQVTYITSNETPCAIPSAVLRNDSVILSIRKV